MFNCMVILHSALRSVPYFLFFFFFPVYILLFKLHSCTQVWFFSMTIGRIQQKKSSFFLLQNKANLISLNNQNIQTKYTWFLVRIENPTHMLLTVIVRNFFSLLLSIVFHIHWLLLLVTTILPTTILCQCYLRNLENDDAGDSNDAKCLCCLCAAFPSSPFPSSSSMVLMNLLKKNVTRQVAEYWGQWSETKKKWQFFSLFEEKKQLLLVFCFCFFFLVFSFFILKKQQQINIFQSFSA